MYKYMTMTCMVCTPFTKIKTKSAYHTMPHSLHTNNKNANKKSRDQKCVITSYSNKQCRKSNGDAAVVTAFVLASRLASVCCIIIFISTQYHRS